MLKTFIFEGFVEDPFKEFFVQNGEFVHDKVPAFLVHEADQIYKTGQSLAKLKSLRSPTYISFCSINKPYFDFSDDLDF